MTDRPKHMAELSPTEAATMETATVETAPTPTTMETASEARPTAESVAPRDTSMIETTERSGMHTAGTMWRRKPM